MRLPSELGVATVEDDIDNNGFLSQGFLGP